ncbi:MAG: endolytic transglycosylase MltG, partial [Bacteroidota bacterium]
HIGLPPGPICIPSIRSIDAVLENEQHPYFFFCARADFSGYHSFAKSYGEHLRNARLFQRELDRRGIRS